MRLLLEATGSEREMGLLPLAVEGTAAGRDRAGGGSPGSALSRAALWRPRSVAVAGAALTLSLVALLLGGSVIAGSLAGAGTLGYAVLVLKDLLNPAFGARVHGPLGPPLRPQVEPAEIAPDELRSGYVAILLAYEELRVTLRDGPRVAADVLRDVYTRCGDIVQAAGRAARNGNAMHTYLSAHGPGREETLRLSALAAATDDDEAARGFRHAAAASRQQEQLHRQVAGHYDRVRARLASVLAFLGVVHALGVKLQILDLEPGSSITECVDELRAELEELESSLEGALAT